MAFSAKPLEDRSREFAVQAVLVCRGLKTTPELWDALRQFVRSATSVGANHRAMSRARSSNECAAKLQIVCEEVDEACYWLELLEKTLQEPHAIAAIHNEARELRAIFSKARATMRARIQN